MVRGYRFELVKLVAQWRIRLLVLACWIAPAFFVAAVSQQSTLPVDTLFGRWMHATGWAGPLVVLGFAGTWALPLLTSVVAGDVFAVEDRLGTWRHLLVAVRSPRRIFAAKAFASLTVLLLLVAGLACSSAAGGIAATFNAPLAGVFFAMELILRDFTAESFGMVVLASVTASVIGRAAFSNTPFLHLPAFSVQHVSEYLLFALLGVIAGAVGVAFTRILYRIEDACDFAWRGPEWARPAVGGLLLGGLLLVLPQMYGVGYPVLENAVSGKYVIGFLLLLLVGKITATSLTIGIGGSGGVFAPSLFMGAMLGAAYGTAAHGLAPGITGPVGAYGLIGMGAVFAGAARAPITAVIIMFELTGEYSIILPLMTAIVLATGVSRALSRDTIYSLKLRRRGIDLDHTPTSAPLAGITASAVMEPVPEPLSGTTPLAEALDALARSPHGVLPVLGADGAYLGTATARSVAETLADGAHDATTVAAITHLPKPVIAATELSETLDALVTAEGAGLPVLDDSRTRLLGRITHQAVLTALHHGPTAEPQPAAP
ncbi:hypothetical protein GCM10010211_74920 [Streptomyces albospinus]|uniref:CBS domain-containing protein n=1 Tax=Streptomyces albospinus TaxID=285515 RepID=A0ABQ2VP12_9ACTN|nr:chloride channel protein [Streptomyces albospinus]GGU96572.1 hypothetical protein GCM10010211_74920 [Streptomyces albospinus]